MAISAIQSITNFSTFLPATSVAPPELLSVASDFVTMLGVRGVVTVGEAQPLSPAAPPPLDSSGRPLTPGTTAQTPQSQALADQLFAALGSSTVRFSNTTIFLGVVNRAPSSTPLDLLALELEMNLLDATNINNLGLLNSAGSSDFSGVLAAEVQLAIAGIGAGNANSTALGTTNGAAANLGTDALLGASTTTAATASATAAAPPLTPATVAPATVPAATVPTATAPPAIAPAATAPPAAVPAATVPTAVAPAALTAPAPTAITAAPPAPTAVATALPTPAEVLQRLVADVTGRALANIVDPGFAATSANLFVASAVLRATNGPGLSGMGTADIAGNPPAEVTAAQPARAV